MQFDQTYEGQYRFSSSRKIGLLLFLILLVSLPLTVGLIKTGTTNQQYSAAKCIFRPACLDSATPCKLPEPENGWCPKAIDGTGAVSISTVPQVATPTSVTPTPANMAMCGECLSHNEKYVCTNQKNNKQFCFALTITAPGYSCAICPGSK